MSDVLHHTKTDWRVWPREFYKGLQRLSLKPTATNNSDALQSRLLIFVSLSWLPFNISAVMPRLHLDFCLRFPPYSSAAPRIHEFDFRGGVLASGWGKKLNLVPEAEDPFRLIRIFYATSGEEEISIMSVLAGYTQLELEREKYEPKSTQQAAMASNYFRRVHPGTYIRRQQIVGEVTAAPFEFYFKSKGKSRWWRTKYLEGDNYNNIWDSERVTLSTIEGERGPARYILIQVWATYSTARGSILVWRVCGHASRIDGVRDIALGQYCVQPTLSESSGERRRMRRLGGPMFGVWRTYRLQFRTWAGRAAGFNPSVGTGQSLRSRRVSTAFRILHLAAHNAVVWPTTRRL
ncbi:hypothetical protein B0H16DRAFT_1788390 [Mycena metata]|uniref:Uncharacterized protein n=1 Tax=Mycena metata TaxID=1033252 RepID=A0AAD7HLU1_9AGAR|nr:hypothetical protein B0H16DRAFT_1788390 [Mycena metata]